MSRVQLVPPPVHALDFYRALGSVLSQLADFLGILLTDTLLMALSAAEDDNKETCVSSTGIRTAKLPLTETLASQLPHWGAVENKKGTSASQRQQ